MRLVFGVCNNYCYSCCVMCKIILSKQKPLPKICQVVVSKDTLTCPSRLLLSKDKWCNIEVVENVIEDREIKMLSPSLVSEEKM